MSDPLIGKRVPGAGHPIRMDAEPRMHAEPMVADPLSRCVAKFLDVLMAAAISHLAPPIGFFAGVTYLLIADGVPPGRSAGKRLLGLAVRGPRGRECGVRESILRNAIVAGPYALWHLLAQGGWLLGVVGGLVFVGAVVLEGVLLAGNPQGLRLGDELAETRVVGVTVTDRA